MKKCLALVMALLLLVSLTGCGKKYEGRGYKTPEKAVEAYVKALQSGNSKKLLKTCAIETYVENWDFAAYEERLNVYSPKTPVPGGTDMADTINLGIRLNAVTTMVENQLKFFMDVEGLTEGATIGPMRGGEYGDGEDLAELMDTDAVVDKLKDASILEIEEASDFMGLENTERYEENLEKQARSIGADDFAEYVVTMKIDGETYVLALNTVRYGKRWYVFGVGGSILGISVQTGGFAKKSELDI